MVKHPAASVTPLSGTIPAVLDSPPVACPSARSLSPPPRVRYVKVVWAAELLIVLSKHQPLLRLRFCPKAICCSGGEILLAGTQGAGDVTNWQIYPTFTPHSHFNSSAAGFC